MTRLIDADALFIELTNWMDKKYDQRSIYDLITNAPTVQREGWVSVPDIETLAKEHDVYEVGDYGNTYPISLERLENFAKAYHKAMIQSAPTDTE